MRQILLELVRRGHDPDPVCRGLGFAASDLESDSLRVSYAQASALIRRALPLLGGAQAGLRLGACLNPVTWRCCYLGLLAAADSRAMLDLAVEFLPSTGRFLRIHGEDSADAYAVVIDPRFDDPAVFAFLVDLTFASLARIGRQVVGPAFGPISIAFTAARPAGAVLHAQSFQCPVAFGQTDNRMRFSHQLSLLATADTLVACAMQQALRLQHAVFPAVSSLVTTVTLAVRTSLHATAPLQSIAASVHLTERTLRRRLQAAGLSFAAILDAERRTRALQLLRDGHLPLAEVAAATGFADVRGLRRATMRWTGLTARQIQAAPR